MRKGGALNTLRSELSVSSDWREKLLAEDSTRSSSDQMTALDSNSQSAIRIEEDDSTRSSVRSRLLKLESGSEGRCGRVDRQLPSPYIGRPTDEFKTLRRLTHKHRWKEIKVTLELR